MPMLDIYRIRTEIRYAPKEEDGYVDISFIVESFVNKMNITPEEVRRGLENAFHFNQIEIWGEKVRLVECSSAPSISHRSMR